MIRIYFLFVVFSFAQICFAQYDDWSFAEIYLKDGTVLKGQGRIPITQSGSKLTMSKEKLRYRVDASGSKKIDPKDIEKIYFNVQPEKGVKTKRVVKGDPKLFIIIYKNDKKSKLGFAELLIDGKVKLVKRKVKIMSNNMISEFNEYLFVKDNGKATVFSKLELKSFKKRASEFFKDCPSLVKKINKKTFGRRDLIEIAQYYNANCAKKS